MKYYKVIKDHPLWIKDAIISNNKENNVNYFAIDEIFCKDIPNLQNVENWYESKNLVENSPDFFERVYQVNNFKNIFYETKEKALEIIKNKFK